jgi:DNA polymerase III alpha subunit (gram-positive type)
MEQMLTADEFEKVIERVRKGLGLRAALELEGKSLDHDMQDWFLEDQKREEAYLSAKKEAEVNE